MNLATVLEYRFERTPDGRIWAPSVYSYQFWTRFLAVFERVQVIARVRDVKQAEPDWYLASGDKVSFCAVPNYQGPREYLQRFLEIKRTISTAVSPQDAVLLRVPSQIATLIVPQLVKRAQPYGVQIVGDPYDVFAPGVVEHPLRPFFRWWGTKSLQRQCRMAAVTAYVTNQTLQGRYPPAPGSFSTAFSDVELPEDRFVEVPRNFVPGQRSFRIVTVASLAQLYKAPDILIDAVAECVGAGVELSLTIIGDGKYRELLEEQVRQRGLGDRIHFLGQLPSGEPVLKQLDKADLFVLPSRTEGLPRALIEAMARGLPCIGSTAGGIPELLHPEDLVEPGDVPGLVAIMRAVLSDGQRLNTMSTRNLAKAREYGADVLTSRREDFYARLRAVTEHSRGAGIAKSATM